MTVNQANDMVRGLIGEDDYHHMKGVLAGYYDIAQKQIATTVSPIRKSMKADCGKLVELPQDMYRLIRADGSYRRVDEEHIIIDGAGESVIRYLAYPSDITAQSSGKTEFEVSIEAQAAIPYFAAAYAVLADSDMRRYYAFIDTYNTILSNIAAGSDAHGVITVLRTEDM